ncbi:MAG: chitobiase/beta-hexosaminidase C-terminal domain-containing protein [bacterium]
MEVIVQISSDTEGALIRYTTNGTTPSRTNGIKYNTPFTLNASTVVKAVAYKTNWQSSSDSDIAEKSYETGRVHTPVMNPPEGYYTGTENIEITTATAEAVIVYTVDNTTPSRSNGMEYSGPIAVSSDTKIKAMAYREDWESSTDSMIAEASYTITGSVRDPIISPSPGNYTDAQNIVITTETSGAEIRYTLNNEPPTRTNGFLYTGSINVDSSATVKAIAYKTEWEESSDSNVVTSEFTITGNVRNPEISPSGGFFTDNASVSLSSPTENAVIKYTTDGSTPSRTNGITYSSEFLIDETSTVKAIAYRTDWQESSDSDISQSTYTITGKVVPPVFEKDSGNYTNSISTSITSETDGAVIRYTTDETTPSRTHGYLYTGPISVSSTTDIKAIAYKEDWQESSDSNTSSASYTITGKVITPVISMVEGSGPDEVDVTISTETSGATIRYTTNGTDPSRTNGTTYSATFTLNSTTTIKAIAYKEDWQESSDSDIARAEYDTGKVLTPNFSPQEGYYTDTTAVQITTGTTGAIIRYTTDESTPSRTNGITYTGDFDVSSPTTIKTMAYKDSWDESTDSDVATATYTVTGQVADPVIDPSEGYFTSSTSVSITCSTPEANIRYTTDGSLPSRSNGVLYSGPFTISSTTTIKAIGYRGEWQESSNSAITEADINITGAVSAPQFTPAAGNYTEAQDVFISSETPGAVITYTTDNTAPTRSSNSYDEETGVFVNSDTTLRVLAYVPEWEESSDTTSTAEYTITGSVSPPEISPEEGTYEESVSVTLNSSNPDAIIRYTTDGTNPDRNSGTIYTDSFTLYSTKTIKAFAYVETWETSSDSPVVFRTFDITGTVAAPTFSPEPLPESEVTADPVYVKLNVDTSDAQIRYTTDGTTPTSTYGSEFDYNDPSKHIAVTEPTTIKAIAYKDNWTDSPVVTKTYYMKVAQPTYTPGEGTYNDAVSVTLNVDTSGANMKYTTDGSEPSEGNGTLYEGPFEFSSGGYPLKVIAYKDGWASSYANILYEFKVAAPEFSVPSGIYNTKQEQTVSTSTSQAKIRYSYVADSEYVDDFELNCDSFNEYENSCKSEGILCQGIDNLEDDSTDYKVLRYCEEKNEEDCVGEIQVYDSESISVDLTIDSSKTTRAIACRSSFEESAVATNSIELKVAKPVIGDLSGTSVFIHHRYSEAEVEYSTDSGSPSQPGSEVTSINKPTIIKAIAKKGGWTNSDMASKLIEPDDYTYSSVVTYNSANGSINDVITDTANTCSDLCIVEIPSGTYNQDISMSDTDKVSIRGDAGDKPTINGKVTFPGGLTEVTFIEHLNIIGIGDENTTTAVSILSGSSPTIRNCTINGGNTATAESRALRSMGSTPLIYNNEINGGSGDVAIAVKNKGTNRLFMINNNIYGEDNYPGTDTTEFYGLYNEDVTGDVLLHDNTITAGSSNDAYGIYNKNSSGIEIFGNLTEGCTQCDNFYGIFNTESSEKIFIVNNIIEGTENAENSYNIYNKSPHTIISNNTILVRGPADYDTVGIYNFMSSGYTGKLNIVLKNNIIFDETGSSSYCLYERNTSSNFSKVSNNNLYGCDVFMKDDGTGDLYTIEEINNIYKDNETIDPQFDVDYMSSQTDLIFGLNLVNDYYFPTNESFNPVDKQQSERAIDEATDWMTGAYKLK